MSAGAFKTSPEQLKATKDKKDKKDKKSESFRPREAREFPGRRDKNSNTVKTQKFHTSGVCLREDKNSGHKFRTIIRILGIYDLRMLVA